jgi:hypothetical protein
MRLILLLVAGLLTGRFVDAQEPQPSSVPAETSSVAHATLLAPAPAPTPAPTDEKPALDFPVSLEKIRDALEHAPATPVITAFSKKPDFRVEIRERRKIDELLSTLNFKAGPTPAGGIYAYEQNRMVFPPVDNPLAQPYSAFNQGQLLTILVENLVGKYLGERVVGSVTKAMRENAEAAARREVEEAIAEFCAAKPDKGAGILLCVPMTPPGPDHP